MGGGTQVVDLGDKGPFGDLATAVGKLRAVTVASWIFHQDVRERKTEVLRLTLEPRALSLWFSFLHSPSENIQNPFTFMIESSASSSYYCLHRLLLTGGLMASKPRSRIREQNQQIPN
jgi:hypothetical protein